MSQSSIMSEFRSAYEIGKSKQAEVLTVNPVLETIQAFSEDKRVAHFEEDLPQVIRDTITGTLTDANRLRESSVELKHLISRLQKMDAGLLDRANQIIQDQAEAGVTEEGNFKIVPLNKRSNRKVNRDLIVSEHKAKYDLLLANKIEELQETYTPTIKEVEAVFGKRADTVLIPGSVQVVGYDIELIVSMPEKAAEVEL